MKINGIGIVSKKVAMGILTREGREAVKNGDITLEELGEMYKLNQVKKCSKIGTCGDAFRQVMIGSRITSRNPLVQKILEAW